MSTASTTPGRDSQTRRDFFQSAACLAPVALAGFRPEGSGPSQRSEAAPLGAIGPRRSDSQIARSLRELAARTDVFDTHEHLWHEEARLSKKVDVFLLFSHYTIDDLISAGMAATAAKSLQDTGISLERRWSLLAPYWSHTRTTGYGRCILIAARDLYEIDDINERTYALLSERIAAANRPGWYETVLKKKARISVSVLDDLTTSRGQPLKPDPRFFKIVTRFDHFVSLRGPKDLSYIEQVTGVSVNTLANLEDALGTAFQKRVREGLAGVKTGLAYQRTLDFRPVGRAEAERAFEALFAGRAQDETTGKLLGDYMMHKVIQQAGEYGLPVQIHTGLQAGNRNRVSWTNPSHLSGLLGEYPQVRFDLFHGGYPFVSEFATLAKNQPNVFADLCWLHIISPGAARRLLHELIETVPANKILGFGGDFFHVEGAYAHAQMARAITAEVLAEKVEDGYLTEAEAARLLERILHRNGMELFSRPPDDPNKKRQNGR